jgi:hypothetical protein
MDDKQRAELVNETLTEAVQELMVYRRFALSLCEDPKTAEQELDYVLDNLRSDDSALLEVRATWHTYLETHLAHGGMFRRTLLLNFVQEWSLPNRREMN